MGGRGLRGLKAAEARTEALRVLRTNLLVAVADLDHPVVVVTSANRAEGKTATCAGLGRSLAAAGLKVALVDLDLRHPELHERLGAANDVGAADVLARRRRLADAIQLVGPSHERETQGLYLLAAGPSVGNATELLGSPATGQLLASIASQADVVLVDSAPVLPVADTLVLGQAAAGALLVVEAGRTSEEDVLAAHAALERSQVRVLGLALNKLDAREVRLGYGYGDGNGTGNGAADLAPGGTTDGWAPTWADPPT